MITEGKTQYQCTNCELVYSDVMELDLSGTQRICPNCNGTEFIVFLSRIIVKGIIAGEKND
jgi:predicted  nucleic acid-binding Zn-ribbon protein